MRRGCRLAWMLGLLAVLASGCARQRVMEELRREERLLRQEEFLRGQLDQLERQNRRLAYESDYLRRRREVVRHETAWWQVYGRQQLGRCIAIVNQLIASSDGRLHGVYASYHGAACRERSGVETRSGILVVDFEHAFDGAVTVTGGMVHVARAADFNFVVLRPLADPRYAGRYRVVWQAPPTRATGGGEQRWHFVDGFQARAGDLPGIAFPGPAHLAVDEFPAGSSVGLGRTAILSVAGRLEVGSTVTVATVDTRRRYSFALMGVGSGE